MEYYALGEHEIDVETEAMSMGGFETESMEIEQKVNMITLTINFKI